jgi:uncharacterized protein YbjT (DUF2867 family)
MTALLIAGATGLVGSHALDRALADHRVARVVAPTRRPLSPHPKLVNPVTDFSRPEESADWGRVDGAILAIGTTRAKAGSLERQRAIDLDLSLKLARLALAAGAQSLALVSSSLADPASRSFYMRMKGELEEALAALDFRSLTIVRPGLLGGKRTEFRLAERIAAAILTPLDPLLPRHMRISPADLVAGVLLSAAIAAEPGRHLISAGQIVRGSGVIGDPIN